MSDLAAFGNSLERAGRSIMSGALSVYEVDARNQADQAEIDLAERMEAFQQSLLTDPDHGTPGGNDGYMKRWADEQKSMREMLKTVENPYGRKMAEQTLDRLVPGQTTRIASLQFQKWAANTDASQSDLIRRTMEASGLGAQAKLDFATEKLDFLMQSNIIQKADRDARLAAWSQVAIGKDLDEAAKTGYLLGGLGRAERAVAECNATWTAGGNPYTAGPEAKEAAIQRIRAYAASIDSTYDAEMQEAYSRMVEFDRNGTQPKGPILTVERIQRWATQEGYAPSPAKKLYWLDRLESFDNGKKTGAGTSASDVAGVYLGQLEKLAMALNDTRGGVNAGAATIPIFNPKTGKTRSFGVSRDSFDALVREPDFVEAVDAAGAWDKVATIREKLGKPIGAWDAALEKYKKDIDGKAGSAELRAEVAYKMKAPGSAEWTPDQIEKYMKEAILGKGWNFQVQAQLKDFDFKAPSAVDPIDKFARWQYDGRGEDYVVRDDDGRGKVTNPLIRDAHSRALAAIQQGLQGIGVQTTAPYFGERGIAYFQGKVSEVEDVPIPPVDVAKARASGRPSYGALQGVTYTVAPVGEDRDARYIRDLTFPNNLHVIQARVWNGGAWEWVSVTPDNPRAPSRFQMSADDFARIDKSLREFNTKERDSARLKSIPVFTM